MGGRMWSTYADLGNPYGISLSLSQPLVGKLDVSVIFAAYSRKTDYVGEIPKYGPPSPPEEHIIEIIENRGYLRSLELIFIYPALRFSRLEVGLGSSVSTNTVGARKRGMDSGRRLTSEQDKFGLGFLLQIEVERITGLPLNLALVYKWKALSASGFYVDGDNTFSPAMQVSEMQLGVSYSL